jgi:SMODS-associated and fused to various effectors sensor domain
MSKIPIETTRRILWGLAAGRCQYDGCNEKLYEDPLTKSEFNQAYVAHIIAESPIGPRGHEILSEKRKADLSNLMLLCDRHHRLIDIVDEAGHSVDRLTKMKKLHEDRITLLTEIKEEKRSNVVLFGANVGNHNSPITLNSSQQAMILDRFPAETNYIELSLKNSSRKDDDLNYWEIEVSNLERLFERKIAILRDERAIKHYSIFGFAPQALLIKFGTLLGDIYPADVYQLKKEPIETWSWLEDDTSTVIYEVTEPKTKTDLVALKFSLSATISDERVTRVLGNNCSIWELTINNPHNDFIKRKEHLSDFRKSVRKLLDDIKLFHGEDVQIHVFPAMAVSTSIELGRVWNPKSQLPLVLYDHNWINRGFTKAFEITHK